MSKFNIHLVSGITLQIDGDIKNLIEHKIRNAFIEMKNNEEEKYWINRDNILFIESVTESD